MVTPPPAPLTISFPAQLPISDRVDEITHAIQDHQVVVVAGETGSGKTTQLPKICLQLGRGRTGLIGHTQPRRLAARAVADRLADELQTSVGELVGYQVRFTDRVGDQTMVKVMTDGILLAELAHDRHLRRYDTLIIDEAHERSLNIDFLLGYLKQLLPRRPDLKVIITSATIEPHRFAAHFAELTSQKVPVVEVSGRTYPVEVRYRPYGVDDDDRDQTQAICDAVDELAVEGPGDVLVFLSGEREIRDTADALRRHIGRQPRHRDTEILPLFARLSLAEQHRVFSSHSGRRIVLATNVAETSLTVPGIRYVIDPGTARISRYSHRLKVQRLPIEPISQASAIQRAGRCGRVAEGVCIRLYSQDDFADRPAYTEPEILRTNLASVILQMAALRLGDVARFPFLDPPDHRQVADGVRLLDELGAIQTGRGTGGGRGSRRAAGTLRLTGIGRKLAQLPIDPRLARMVLAADREGCLREVCVIAAALSIQDPRERPADRREAADTKHARFVDERSDFWAYLNLWHYLQDKQKELSGNQFRRMCRDEFLNYLRVREWQDVHHQLRRVARTLGGSLNSQPADPDRVHVALLAGLLSHIGVKDLTSKDPKRRHEYLGARGARFAIAPGSVLFKRSPQWVMVAELVETTRLWGRVAATIKPEWVEPLAAHLLTREYSEPHWDRKRAAAVAYEKVSLYGVPIIPRRKVDYGRIDPTVARELFIRNALVAGEWDTHHAFVTHNQQLLQQAEELEHRARRRDIVVDEQALFEFFDRRIDQRVISGAHFDRWWKQERRNRPELLHLTMELLTTGGGALVREVDFPGHWRHNDVEFPLTYQFDPGSATDGVTAEIDLAQLDEAAQARLDWQVPGLRRDLVIALIRSLPKAQRRAFVPVPDVADEVLAGLDPYTEPLLVALAQALSRLAGHPVSPEAFQLARVPAHLRVTYRVVDAGGHTLAEGKDLAALQEQLRPAVAADLSAAAADIERRGLREWDDQLGTLPHEVTLRRGGRPVTAYPGLIDTGDAVDVRVFTTAAERDHHLGAGVRRLLQLACPSPATYVAQRLSRAAKLALAANPHGDVRILLADCAGCAIDALLADGQLPRDAASFHTVRRRVCADLNRATLGVVTEVLPVLNLAQQVQAKLDAITASAAADAVMDLRAQLGGLIRPGFVTDVGWQRLPDLRRYLEAMLRRVDKLPAGADRDRRAMAQVHEVRDEYEALAADPPAGVSPADINRLRWMIEELRVSLFAQQLGTRHPVSARRIFQVIDQLTDVG